MDLVVFNLVVWGIPAVLIALAIYSVLSGEHPVYGATVRDKRRDKELRKLQDEIRKLREEK